MDDAIQQFESMLQNDWVLQLITIVVILVIAAIVTRLMTRFLRKVLMHDATILPSSSIFINIGRATIWVIAICIILTTCFNVNVSAVVAALGVGGIAVSLGFQDTISNLIGGLQVSIMKIIQPGDNIQVGDSEGIVRDVTWRHTTIVNSSGETIIIPNSTMNKTSLIKLQPLTHVAVPFVVRVSANDLDSVAQKVETKSRQAIAPISKIIEEPKVRYIGMTEFGFQAKVTFRVRSATHVNEMVDIVLRAIAPLVLSSEDAFFSGDTMSQ